MKSDSLNDREHDADFEYEGGGGPHLTDGEAPIQKMAMASNTSSPFTNVNEIQLEFDHNRSEEDGNIRLENIDHHSTTQDFNLLKANKNYDGSYYIQEQEENI